MHVALNKIKTKNRLHMTTFLTSRFRNDSYLQYYNARVYPFNNHRCCNILTLINNDHRILYYTYV